MTEWKASRDDGDASSQLKPDGDTTRRERQLGPLLNEESNERKKKKTLKENRPKSLNECNLMARGERRCCKDNEDGQIENRILERSLENYPT